MNVVLLTFDSVTFTMLTEKKLIEKGFETKIIPTPREISRSCGLALMLKIEDLDEMVKLKEELPIGYIWSYKKSNKRVEVEKIS